MDDDDNPREQRLAAALRANLQRRKHQARRRGRADSDTPEQPDDTGRDAPAPDRPAGKA